MFNNILGATILSSAIRIYDVFNPSFPEKVIHVGPKISKRQLHSSVTSGNTFSTRLEEATSFDFGTPYEDNRSGVESKKKVTILY